MNPSALFIRRPVATLLLTLALALVGVAAFWVLPVSPLPQVDFPTIVVQARLPGASPDTMARNVATPLERPLRTIAGVTDITSNSSAGSTRVVLEFELSRDINGAAREVQAAINAARHDLPITLRSQPEYRKRNPSDSPVIVLALTSETRTPGQIYDAVSTLISQRLAQIDGVGDVELGGGSQPALRVELDPQALRARGLSSDDIRAALQSAFAQRPLGALNTPDRRLPLDTPGLEDPPPRPANASRPPPAAAITAAPSNASQLATAAAALPALVIAWRDGAPVRLSDVARIETGVENSRTRGLFNGQPAVVALVSRQPHANIIETVEAIRDVLPSLQAQLPQDIRIQVASDRTGTIRRALHEVEFTLFVSIALVVMVVGVFLGSLRATLIPAIATVSSLLASLAVMQAFGYSLNNLSLMALTVATGFVVDDAIVVVENIARHLARLRASHSAPGPDGGPPRPSPATLTREAALRGAREVGFTVVSITVSLVAVFLPLVFWDGIVGRFLREFAVTLSAAVLVSLLISLTTTPMLCAALLRERCGPVPTRGRLTTALMALGHSTWQGLLRHYASALDWALTHRAQVIVMLLCVIGLNVLLFVKVPKGFIPEQDSGQIVGGLTADRSIASAVVGDKLQDIIDLIRADPAVDTVVGFTGGGRQGGGFLFINLKPRDQRSVGAIAVAARLRPQLAKAVSGVRVFLSPTQEFRGGGGGHSERGSVQYVLRGTDLNALKTWSQRLAEALRSDSRVSDVDTDWEENTLAQRIDIDRDAAARLGVQMRDIDQALYNAFGQRPVATLYGDITAYNVVMEWAPEHQRGPEALTQVMVPARLSPGTDRLPSAAASTPTRVAANPARRDAATTNALSTQTQTLVPLSAVAHFSEGAVPTTISHEDGELATTLTFNLPPGKPLGIATQAVEEAQARVGLPNFQVRGNFAGAAKRFQAAQSQQWLMILATLAVIYIVLGVLYESFIHPLTVLSTLPSAGVGAVIALMLMDMDLSIVALIGLLLLIGIVKKNAILIIDFAIEAERTRGLNATEAVREACLLRLRPILMTTLAAALGALPLAIGLGEGAELRQPLGVSIIGGLLLSQVLTLLTTPVVYVVLDRWRATSVFS